jgi:hypothetical protein
MLVALALCLPGPVRPDTVYLSQDAFLAQAFDGDVPSPAYVWIDAPLAARMKAVLGAEPAALRVRHWARGPRSAWVLDAVGKERPITTGIVVDGGGIERIRVLVYRESRGAEVRHGAFTRQFEGARLAPDLALDRDIAGISGATLSVRALQRLARLALVLDAARQTPAH